MLPRTIPTDGVARVLKRYYPAAIETIRRLHHRDRFEDACHEAGAYLGLGRGDVLWALEAVADWARERGRPPDETLRTVVIAGMDYLDGRR